MSSRSCLPDIAVGAVEHALNPKEGARVGGRVVGVFGAVDDLDDGLDAAKTGLPGMAAI